MEYKNGERFYGNFKRGKLENGHGISIFALNDSSNRVSYEGNFLNGQRSGYGIFKWKSGEKFEGEFKNGFRDGNGTVYYANGDIYQGNFQDDKKMDLECILMPPMILTMFLSMRETL